MANITLPLQSDTPFSDPFVFISCDMEDYEVPESILQQVYQVYQLLYYNPHLDEALGQKSSSFHLPYEVVTDPLSRVIIGFLSSKYMISFPCLMELLSSQLGENPLPYVPVVLEAVPLMNDQGYEDFLETLTGDVDISEEEEKVLREKLELMYTKLQRNTNYANYSQDTMMKWLKYAEDQSAPLSQSLCYAILKEIINSLNCNFIFQPHYSESTLPYLYRDLSTRIRNSTIGIYSPFLEAKPITAKEELFFFSQFKAQGVVLEEFHRATAEECEIRGGTLVKYHGTHPKVMLSFSVKEIGGLPFSITIP